MNVIYTMYTMYINTKLAPNQKGHNSFAMGVLGNIYWSQAVRIEHLIAESCGLLC